MPPTANPIFGRAGEVRVNTGQGIDPIRVATNPQNPLRWDDFIQEIPDLVPQVAGVNPYTKKTGVLKVYTVQSHWGITPHEDVVKAATSHPGLQLFGVELEIENWPTHRLEASSPGIVFKEDGSLRNNGIEGITKPNTKFGALACVKKLWEKYSIGEKNFSDRTSIHVHANVLDFTQDQLKTLVLLYGLFENVLFDIVEPERKNNIFCVPWSQAGLNAGNYTRVFARAANWQKYTALNLLTVTQLGTVEFRHMHGHADFVLLTHWIQVIEDLVTFAKKSNPEEIYKRVIDLNTSSEYYKFMCDVFQQEHEFITQVSKDWESHMVYGVIEAKLNAID
jgi:hypothetical protein